MDNTEMFFTRAQFVVPLVLVLPGCVSNPTTVAKPSGTPPLVAQEPEIPNPGIKDPDRFNFASRIVTDTGVLKKMAHGVTFSSSNSKKATIRPEAMAILALSFSPFGLDASQSTAITYSVSVIDPSGKSIAQYEALKLNVKVTKANEVVMVSPVRMIHRSGESLGTYKVLIRGYDQTLKLVAENELEFEYVN